MTDKHLQITSSNSAPLSFTLLTFLKSIYVPGLMLLDLKIIQASSTQCEGFKFGSPASGLEMNIGSKEEMMFGQHNYFLDNIL